MSLHVTAVNNLALVHTVETTAKTQFAAELMSFKEVEQNTDIFSRDAETPSKLNPHNVQSGEVKTISVAALQN